jgi:hypothetical protein
MKVEQNCSCYYTGLERVSSQILPCLNKTQLICFNNIYGYIGSNLASYIYNLFSNEFNNRFVELTNVNDTVTYDVIKEYFYSINVYYSSTQYTYINEQPQMTLVGLFSNLGGNNLKRMNLIEPKIIFTLSKS